MYQYIKRRYLAWIGVIGLSVSIVGAMEPVIQIANFIHYLVAHWHELTAAIWDSALGLFGLHAEAGVAALLNAGAFCFALEISAMTAPRHAPSLKSFALGALNRIVTVVLFYGILLSSFIRLGEPIKSLVDPLTIENWFDRKNWLLFGVWFFAMSFSVGIGGNPYVLARRLLDVAAFCLIILLFNFIALDGPTLRDWILSVR